MHFEPTLQHARREFFNSPITLIAEYYNSPSLAFDIWKTFQRVFLRITKIKATLLSDWQNA
jgi:hypothetical protein